MKPKPTTPLAENEAEVRRLRDNIYGPADDNAWEICGPNWCKPENIQWLRDHQPKPKPK